MRISHDWRIETDPFNVILQRRKINARGNNVGKERWESVGFYGTHKEALRAMVELEIRVPQEYEEIVVKIDELTAQISALPINEITSRQNCI